jgi:hypothetical protein
MTRERGSADATGFSDDEATAWLNPSVAHVRCPTHGLAPLFRCDGGRIRIIAVCCDDLDELCRNIFVARDMQS